MAGTEKKTFALCRLHDRPIQTKTAIELAEVLIPSIHLKNTVDETPLGSPNAPSVLVPAYQLHFGDLPPTRG